MLGLGHSLVAGSALDSAYAMTKSYAFDATDDIFLTNTVNGNAPADGTAKTINRSLSVAAWARVDDGSADPYTDGAAGVIVCTNNTNTGWSLHYNNNRFYFDCLYDNGDDTNFSHSLNSSYAKMKAPTSGTDYTRFLYKSDHWHFVVATVNMEDPSTSVVTNLYVDGNRAQAGDTSGSSSTNFGSEPETAASKKTTTASGGNIILRYDSSFDRDEVDLAIGARASFTQATDASGFRSGGFYGQIGDVAIWENHVLTEDEIATLYNLHVPIDMATVQNTKLIGHWSPTRGNDDLVSGTTGTLLDDAAVVTDSPSLDVSGYAGYQ